MENKVVGAWATSMVGARHVIVEYKNSQALARGNDGVYVKRWVMYSSFSFPISALLRQVLNAMLVFGFVTKGNGCILAQ